MLIRPTEEELANFGEPDFIIHNAGQFPANRFTKGMSSTTSVKIISKRMEMGTEYTGETKQGVFSVMVSNPPDFLGKKIYHALNVLLSFNPSSLASSLFTPPCACLIEHIQIPCAVDCQPTNIIMLTCDAFGVLPPVSKLTPAEASYRFLAGYTS
jgi:ATP-dependent phosphoenolpyruvate carboxykinase